ncbi:MAG: shikimate kinase [Bacteroidia bacterium]|nr:MAG: shikimate kinase [Bacteroidia bacterium]
MREDLDRPLFLVGFMACGKSTVGRRLAHELGVDFVDLDLEVETMAGMGIPEIFARDGEVAFRRMERRALEEVLQRRCPMVVATGGGTPTVGDAMMRMRATGWVVYLRVPVNMLVERLKRERYQRPLIAGLEGEELEHFVISHLAEREPCYLEANAVVDARTVEGDTLLEMLRGRG